MASRRWFTEPIPTTATSAAVAARITSRTLVSRFKIPATSAEDTRSGAGIMLTLQAASSWPIPVMYGPTPPESVTRRICCELIKPLRCCRLLMVVSPNPTASSWPGSSTPISDCAAPMPNRTFIGGVFRAGITRTSFRPKRCCSSVSSDRQPS